MIGNVRTVQAFAGEERAVKSYKETLMNAYEYGRRAYLVAILSLPCLMFSSPACKFLSPSVNSEYMGVLQQIGLVNHELALFATTIRDNILYGKDDAKLEEIMRAAELSEAITIINNLPDGFETRQVSDHSGILLLDEATSALDAESEKIITVIVHAVEHLCFGIMGARLTLRVREVMFSGNIPKQLMFHLVIAAFTIAFILNWRITLVILATFPWIISGHISEKLFMQGYGGNLSKAYLKANMLAGEAVSNIRTVAAFCAEEKILDIYARELIEPSKRSFNRGQIAGIFYGISQFFIFSSYGLGLWYDAAMGETLALVPDLLKGNQMVASVFEIMDRKTQAAGDAGEELTNVEGTIELRGVQFSYPSRSDIVIFNDFDLKVRSGKSMALVGQSGSGKSSVLALILRFYDPTAGKVMIDVQQEPALFATSIYENMLYDKEGASESEIIEAAKLANAHGFISYLPERY
ncbi:hypothetical protein V6N12_004661 [Hibiscus sabdariffa]|uniref:ABC transmembrane type-1 domain-containing protein n=1 Tax=Hibiscus sabdariffa TaxID=183260 RepID=A0ABR2CM62_9ROSI